MLHIPISRWGEPYKSLDLDKIVHFATGEVMAEVSRANGGLVERDMRHAQRAPSRPRLPCPGASRSARPAPATAGPLARRAGGRLGRPSGSNLTLDTSAGGRLGVDTGHSHLIRVSYCMSGSRWSRDQLAAPRSC